MEKKEIRLYCRGFCFWRLFWWLSVPSTAWSRGGRWGVARPTEFLFARAFAACGTALLSVEIACCGQVLRPGLHLGLLLAPRPLGCRWNLAWLDMRCSGGSEQSSAKKFTTRLPRIDSDGAGGRGATGLETWNFFLKPRTYAFPPCKCAIDRLIAQPGPDRRIGNPCHDYRGTSLTRNSPPPPRPP